MHAIESVYKPYARKAVKLSHGEYNTELRRLTDSNTSSYSVLKLLTVEAE